VADKVTCDRGFKDIFRKAICKVDMLIGHANVLCYEAM
jgi:hypothetical protein